MTLLEILYLALLSHPVGCSEQRDEVAYDSCGLVLKDSAGYGKCCRTVA